MPDPTSTSATPELDDSGNWLAGLSAPSRALRDVFEAQDTLLARKAREMGIGPTDMRAIRLIDLHGPLGATDLARLLDLRPASVTTLVDRLTAAGLLERTRSETDRRRIIVRATPHALQRSLQIWAPTLRTMDDLGHDLDPAAQEVICDYLTAVRRALTDPPSADKSQPGDPHPTDARSTPPPTGPTITPRPAGEIPVVPSATPDTPR